MRPPSSGCFVRMKSKIAASPCARADIGVATSAGASTSASLTGLSPSTTYYWHVRAVNTGGITLSNNNTFWRFTTA